MRRHLIVILLMMGTGCSTAVPHESTLPSEEDTQAQRMQEEQENERVRELRAQLALANARTAELEARAGTPLPSRETVRIGEDHAQAQGFFDDEGEEWDEPAETLPERRQARRQRNESRPVLRLYGVPEAPPLPVAPFGAPPVRTVAAPAMPATPSVAPTNEHLPWERPGARAATPVAATPPQAPAAAPQRIDMALDAYRGALGLLQERRFSESLAAFDRFIQTHPSHPRVSTARYWRGELFYIQRQYGQARVAFEGYLRQYPRGAKVADALLKLALCTQRLGDDAGAEVHLQRLRREFPSSNAARLASRGDAR